jgi:hypothetical protein
VAIVVGLGIFSAGMIAYGVWGSLMMLGEGQAKGVMHAWAREQDTRPKA